MRLSRRGKCIRNSLLALLLGFLLLAQWEFPPFTVAGMCREAGRLLLMTPPEPVVVVQEQSGWAANQMDTFIIGKTGESWVSFQYSRPKPFGIWKPDFAHLPAYVNDKPYLTAYGGRLYLIGDLPESVTAAHCSFTIQETVIYQDENRNRSEPEYGQSRDFSFNGVREADGVFSFLYHDPTIDSWFLPDDEKQPADLVHDWFRLMHSGDSSGYGVLHLDIPVDITLRDGEGNIVKTLQLPISTYALGYV